MGVWGGGATINYCNDPLPAGFLFLVFEFSFICFVVDARRVFFLCIINITISKKHLYLFFSLLDSSSTHFVITATTTTTTTCHHHKQHPRTMPVVTPPSTTTNGKLHAHLLSECYGINGDTPDNRTAAQPQFFLVSLMGHNLYLKWQLDWPTEKNC